MMVNRKSVLLAVMMILAVRVAPALRADDDDQSRGEARPTTRPAVARVSLGREMSAMSRAFKTIRQQVADPSKNASTLAAVLDLEQHTLAAKGAVLPSASTMPTAEDRAEKQNDFHGDMITLLRHELDLEEELLANENDKAVKTVADLHDLEEQGHSEFRPKRKN